MELEFVFRDTAFKHGQTEADIRHAFATARYDCPIKDGENRWLLLGFNIKGNPIEVMYNEFDGNGRNVFHAMGAQTKYLPLFDD